LRPAAAFLAAFEALVCRHCRPRHSLPLSQALRAGGPHSSQARRLVPGIMNRRQDRMWLYDSNDSSFYRHP
jgi:hypothetical protein